MNTPLPAEDDERVWEEGWDDHELQQLRRLAKLSLPQKLAWLEEAQRLAQHLASQSPGKWADRP
jgi:hypothetical protein